MASLYTLSSAYGLNEHQKTPSKGPNHNDRKHRRPPDSNRSSVISNYSVASAPGRGGGDPRREQQTYRKSASAIVTTKVEEEEETIWTTITSWFSPTQKDEEEIAGPAPTPASPNPTVIEEKDITTPVKRVDSVRPTQRPQPIHNTRPISNTPTKASSWSESSPVKKMIHKKKKHKPSGRAMPESRYADEGKTRRKKRSPPHGGPQSVTKSDEWSLQDRINFWKDMIAPRYGMFKRGAFLLKMWTKHGLPDKVRGVVWEAICREHCCSSPRMLKDGPGLMDHAYLQKLLDISVELVRTQHAKELEAEQENGNMRPRVMSIENDVRRTLNFDESGALEESDSGNEEMNPALLRAISLSEVLQAFALHSPQLSYIQGMTYLGATLLRVMPSRESALLGLIYLVEQPFLSDFYHVNAINIRRKFQLFDWLFHENLPHLHKRFQRMKLSCDVFLMEWWISLFASVVPLFLAVRAWDGFFLFGEIYLYKFAIALLSTLTPQLNKLSVGASIQLLRNCQSASIWRNMHSADLRAILAKIENVKFSEKLLTQFVKESKRIAQVQDSKMNNALKQPLSKMSSQER